MMGETIVLLFVLATCVAVADCRRWTVDELRSLRFPYSHGVNLGMAVCKACKLLLLILSRTSYVHTCVHPCVSLAPPCVRVRVFLRYLYIRRRPFSFVFIIMFVDQRQM